MPVDRGPWVGRPRLLYFFLSLHRFLLRPRELAIFLIPSLTPISSAPRHRHPRGIQRRIGIASLSRERSRGLESSIRSLAFFFSLSSLNPEILSAVFSVSWSTLSPPPERWTRLPIDAAARLL